MIQRLGKYRIIERLGHGGMGAVFKAEDPMLGRTVALKIISSNVGVTDDEMKRRFMREAQACARLNHDNLIRVYDMGEQDGQLFIVMECLEGAELKQYIDERRALPIEDKLVMMMEVCEGLDYAHKRGIIHRDIKPSNIFVLADGHLKILDFGIARVATAGSDITKSGVLMGTLRYMSPEQARGWVDPRSDIFSVGAVFYEWLTFRVAFAGTEPMAILESIRSSEPPPVTEFDPTLPPELAEIIARCLRKDPNDRYPSLELMRDDLKEVQKRVTDEADRLYAQVRVQWGEMRGLQRALLDEIGLAPTVDLSLDGTPRLARMRDIAIRDELELHRLRDLVRRVETARPAFERAKMLAADGQLADAVRGLERIVADIPEHQPAAALLGRAHDAQGRARLDAEEQAAVMWQQRALVEKPHYARADWERAVDRESGGQDAFEGEDYAVASRLFREAARSYERAAATARHVDDVLAEAVQELELGHWDASLARVAEVLEAAPDDAAARAVAERAEVAKAQAEAEAERRQQLTAQLVHEANAALNERRFALCLEILKQAVSVPAPLDMQPAIVSLRVKAEAESAAAEAEQRARQQAERARWDLAQVRLAAQAARAAEYVPAAWESATNEADGAEEAFRRRVYPNATRGFEAAAAGYRRAEEAARQAREQERRTAEQARGEMEGRAASARPIAVQFAPELWAAAERLAAEANASFERDRIEEAAQEFEMAARAYRRAEDSGRQAQQSEAEAAVTAQREMEECAAAARAAGAPRYVAEQWESTEATAAEGASAVARGAHGAARRAFDEAAQAYRSMEEAARDGRRREREQAERSRDEMTLARRSAENAAARAYARDLCEAADRTGADAYARLGQGAYPEASQLFHEAAAVYRGAGTAAGEAADRERGAAEHAAEEMSRRRAQAQTAGALESAPEHWRVAEMREAEAVAALDRAAHTEAKVGFTAAAEAYRAAETVAREATARAEEGRQRAAADQTRQEMRNRREGARAATAFERAPGLWQTAEEHAGEAAAAWERAGYAEAEASFAWAARAYGEAETAARQAAEREREAARQAAERSKSEMEQLRDRAHAGRAVRYAADLWASGQDRATAAEALLAQARYVDAREEFAAAAEAYRRAEEAARIAMERDRADAERMRQAMSHARERGAAEMAPRRAPELWEAAEQRAAEAEDTFDRAEYAQAAQTFAAAGEAYGRAGAAAREKAERERTAAEQARQEMARGRQSARTAMTPEYASELWETAETMAAAADEALALGEYTEASVRFAAAGSAYQDAEDTSRAVVRREREAVRRAWDELERRRQDVESARGPQYAPTVFQAAADTARAAAAAMAEERFREATELMREAMALYQRAEDTAAEARGRDRALAEHLRTQAEEARTSAASAEAEQHAAGLWADAHTWTAEGDAALAREEYEDARQAFDEAVATFRRAGDQGRNAVRAREEARAAAEKEHAAATEAREKASLAEAPAHAAEQWRAGEALAAEASAALGRGQFDAARRLFAETRRQYVVAERAAAIAREAEVRRIAAMVGEAQALLQAGDVATCLLRLDDILSRKPDHAAAIRLREEARERERTRTLETPPEPAIVSADAGQGVSIADRPVPEAPASASEATRVAGPPQPPAAAVHVAAPHEEAHDHATVPHAGGSPDTVAPRRSRPGRSWKVASALAAAAVIVGIGVYGVMRPGGVVPVRPPNPPSGTAPAPQRDAMDRQQPVPGGQQQVVEPPRAVTTEQKKATDEAGRAVSPPGQDAGKQDAGRQEAARAQSRMVEAQRDAIAAGAPQRAAALWRKAESAKRSAEDTLKGRSPDRAPLLFADADKRYREAEAAARDAQRVALTQDRAEAEAARDAVAAARREAEQAGAARFAAPVFTGARQKEAEAETRLDKQDAAGAKQLFAEAEQAYRQAARDAGPLQVADAKRGDQEQRDREAVERWKAAVVTRREAAVKAEAPRLAKEAFDGAQAKHTEADRLAGQNMAASAQAYQDAAGRYADAVRVAEGRSAERSLAEAARAKMLAEKQRARQDAPAYSEAGAQERRGQQAFERLGFTEATRSFNAATELYAKTGVAPAPEPPKPSANDEIKAFVASYAGALTGRDIEMIRRHDPTLQPDEVRRMQDSWDQSRDQKVQLTVGSVEVKGDHAVVSGRRDNVLTPLSGRVQRSEGTFTFTLKRAGAGWVIESKQYR
jgi:predicted Ser/Thr protein kinase